MSGRNRRVSSLGSGLWTGFLVLAALALVMVLVAVPAVHIMKKGQKSGGSRERRDVVAAEESAEPEDLVSLEGYEDIPDQGKARSHSMDSEEGENEEEKESVVDRRFDFDYATPVMAWIGKSIRVTETFDVASREWALAWYTADELTRHGHHLSVKLKSPKDPSLQRQVMRVVEPDASYVLLRNGPGEFFLDVEATMPWVLVVYDMSGRSGLLEDSNGELSQDEVKKMMQDAEPPELPKVYEKMSYEEVCEIIGRKGKRTRFMGAGETKTATYEWILDGWVFEAEFVNDELVDWTGRDDGTGE